MTAGEEITAGINYDNAGGVQVDDSAQRLRFQQALQRVVNKAWTFRAPTWREAALVGTVAVSSNSNQGTLPADFAGAGAHMRVYLQGQKVDVVYEPDWKLFRRIELQSTTTSRRPLFYTLRGESATGRKYIWVYPAAAIPIVLDIQGYVRKPPVIIDRPSACVAAAGSAGLPSGTYTYQVTFVTANGETEGGAISNAITVVLLQVALTSIPVATFPGADGLVTARKIYRNANGSNQRKLVATINDNLATTYTDNIADGSLGANVPTPSVAVTGLEQIPDQHHSTVIFDAMMQNVARGQGDSRSMMEWTPIVISGLAQMWAEESIHHDRKRAPRYGARGRA